MRKLISVRVNDEQHAFLAAKAEEQMGTMAQMIRIAVAAMARGCAEAEGRAKPKTKRAVRRRAAR